MFIHWGLYSIPARGEWVMGDERIPLEDYRAYFEAFNPKDFDPRAWAKAAKQAGMKTLIIPEENKKDIPEGHLGLSIHPV